MTNGWVADFIREQAIIAADAVIKALWADEDAKKVRR